jgi:Cu(I)/Ag(I) efflux system membrane fusion protein
MKRILLLGAAVILAALAIAFVFLSHGHRTGESGAAQPGEGVEYYTCPMHPSVIQYRPGKCPVCGMTLVRKTSGRHDAAGESPAAGEVVVTGEGRVRADITTFAARMIPLSDSVSVPGVVSFAEPSRTVVAARGRGRIERLFVNRTGAVVRKGEPLLSLYSPDLVSAGEEYLIALSGTDESVRGELVAASRKRLTERFGLTASQITRLERDRDPKGPAVYYSPVAGTVILKSVVEGEYVDEGMKLFELADLSRVWVIASVSEQDIPAVRPGEPVGVTVEAYPGRLFSGRVGFIEPSLDADSRTLRFRTELANPEGHLKVNMFARVMLKPAPRPALVVPASAVLFTGRRPVVWVESEPGHFVPRTVGVGVTAGGYTEILSGLEEGDMVASSGGFLIDSESQLESSAGGEPVPRQK